MVATLTVWPAVFCAGQATHSAPAVRSDLVLSVEDDPVNALLRRTLIASRPGCGYTPLR